MGALEKKPPGTRTILKAMFAIDGRAASWQLDFSNRPAQQSCAHGETRADRSEQDQVAFFEPPFD